MIDQMAKCIMYPVNQKIAFLTYKIVMETIKRAVLKNQVEKYLPVNPSYVKTFKRSLLDAGAVRTHKISNVLSKLGNNILKDFNIPRSDSRIGTASNGFEKPDAVMFEIPLALG